MCRCVRMRRGQHILATALTIPLCVLVAGVIVVVVMVLRRQVARVQQKNLQLTAKITGVVECEVASPHRDPRHITSNILYPRTFLPSFLPHMLCKRGNTVVQCPSVCPSVCLSFKFMDYVETNKHIFNIFHHRVATPFWFFHTERHGNIPTEPHKGR